MPPLGRPYDPEPHHLIVAGNDDLLLQILLREFNRGHPAMLGTSASLGSVAELEAVRERRAHVAGVHLLDPDSGEYNRRQVAAAFPHQRAFLITLAHRQEALILPRVNPRRVSKFADVVRQRLGRANREPGSGVRVLLDHLLSEHRVAQRGQRYDLLTTDEAFYGKPTQTFFDMVKSDWVRQLISKVPAYDARARRGS